MSIGLTGCSDAPELEVESSNDLLIGGVPSGVEHDAVVFVRANHSDGSFENCTGTLLSPSVVATAKHCVTIVQPGPFVCSGAGTLSEDGNGAGLFGARVPPGQIEIYVGALPDGPAAAVGAETFVTGSMDTCHDDVAAIVLDRPITAAPFPPLRGPRPTRVGETIRLIGYGVDEGSNRAVERTEVSDVRVIDVGREDSAGDRSATTPSRSFVAPGGNGCFGDSGGPALSMESGALVGIYSRITGDCLSKEGRNTFMLAGSFTALFESAFEHAGERANLEPAEVSTTPEPAPEQAPEVSEPDSRHKAFQCSIDAPARFGSGSTGVLVLALAAVAVIRRRSARALS